MRPFSTGEGPGARPEAYCRAHMIRATQAMSSAGIVRSSASLAKELKRRSAKNLELLSLNKDHEDRVIPMDEVAWIARVMWARQ